LIYHIVLDQGMATQLKFRRCTRWSCHK